MALSNWDLLAVNQDGETVSGNINHSGVRIEIYKNWLYIHHPEAWIEGGGSFVKPVVMQINDGDIHYGGWTIKARRGPQRGVFVVAYSPQYWFTEPDQAEKFNRGKPVLIAGCGVSGYEDENEKYADQIEAVFKSKGYKKDEVSAWISHSWGDGEEPSASFNLWNEKTKEFMVHPEGGISWPIENWTEVQFVGVTAESLTFLQTMITELAGEPHYKDGEAIEQWPESNLRRIDLTAAQRFNQGDAFFAEHFGIDTPTSGVEKPDEPLITAAIEGMKTRLSGEGDNVE